MKLTLSDALQKVSVFVSAVKDILAEDKELRGELTKVNGVIRLFAVLYEILKRVREK
jgi:hypothetical protein